jgi:glutamate-5-semialdehyde dehydrogenase
MAMLRETASPIQQLVRESRTAARALSRAPTEVKDAALAAIASALRSQRRRILAANARDVKVAEREAHSAAFVDRLRLDDARLEGMARAVEEIRALPDPVGEVVESWTRPNGLRVEKTRLPLGVVLMIYESRPNVTSDAAALCLKSGNAAILRGGSEAHRTNLALAGAIEGALTRQGLPGTSVQLVPTPDRAAMMELISMEGQIDLCIPRGGEGLIRFVAENARVPVVKHYKGVCHVYVHRTADLEMAERIVLNAKAQRPGVCNAAECLLVDRSLAAKFLPAVGRKLVEKKVEIRGCPTTITLLQRARIPVKPAVEDDFGREFLDLILAVRVVRDLDQALEHIGRYGTEHTEAIITRDLEAAERFTREVSASAVMVNASTRFNDGGELGLGAEIGISTSRLHAFGPMGLRELTAQKYVVRGHGQVR